jgi:hypothetical protein
VLIRTWLVWGDISGWGGEGQAGGRRGIHWTTPNALQCNTYHGMR